MSKLEFEMWVGGNCISLVDKELSAEQCNVVFATQRIAEIDANRSVSRFADSSAWEKIYVKKQHELGWMLFEIENKRNKRAVDKFFQPWRRLCGYFIPHLPSELQSEVAAQLDDFFSLPTSLPLLKVFLGQAVAHRTYSSDIDSLAIEFRVITRSMQLYSARLYMLTNENIQSDWRTQMFAPSGLKDDCLTFSADVLHQRVVEEIKADLISWMKKSQADHFKKIERAELNRH